VRRVLGLVVTLALAACGEHGAPSSPVGRYELVLRAPRDTTLARQTKATLDVRPDGTFVYAWEPVEGADPERRGSLAGTWEGSSPTWRLHVSGGSIVRELEVSTPDSASVRWRIPAIDVRVGALSEEYAVRTWPR
jgi:hypothetical protein